ncbi:YjzC family protein [Bifidobacterium sp. 82T10]|uniref:YjzC family protein n=1 Tax=Bifidobacterium miconis TaxID=2834435 RepID=A0ABS6WHC5_9BIFI|nr:YjzC family protein [Bifidobacterium miconis]MBW3093425.1 YjzC family protein [Bifidobacterium miconis]
MVTNHKPGEDNHRPGTYVEVGPRGGAVANSRTVHIDRGDRLPPTQESGHLWQYRPTAKH